MLRPSYSEVMEILEKSDKLDNRVTSRYTVVLAAAKRARQLTDGRNPLTYAPTDRAVSTAVKEMSEGKLSITIDTELLTDPRLKNLNENNRFRSITALSKDDLREDFKVDYKPDQYNTDDADEFTEDEFSVTNFIEEEAESTFNEEIETFNKGEKEVVDE